MTRYQHPRGNFFTSQFRKAAEAFVCTTARELASLDLERHDVYAGGAGVALFLSDVVHFGADEEVRSGAVRLATRAIRWAEETDELGFYFGRLGVATAVHAIGTQLEVDSFESAGLKLAALSDLQTISNDTVLHGTAGALGATVALARACGDGSLTSQVTALADRVLDTAQRGVHGWSWSSPFASVRDLTGLGEGASGTGWALLEAYALTGQTEYRYAFEQSVQYERLFSAGPEGGWLDLRPSPEGPYLGWAADGWCHGTVGIALARLRAFVLTGDLALLRDLRGAIDRLTDAPPSENSGLCHGAASRAALLIDSGRLLSDPTIERIGWATLEQWDFDGPGGYGLAEPGLMDGRAGVAAVFARALWGEGPVLPTALLTGISLFEATDSDASPSQWPLGEADPQALAAAREDYVATFFGETREALLTSDKGRRSWDRLIDQLAAPTDDSDVIRAYRLLRDTAHEEDDVAERSALELATVELLMTRSGYEAQIRTQGLKEWSEDDIVILSERVRRPVDHTILLLRSGRHPDIVAVDPITGWLISKLNVPQTFGSLTDDLLKEIGAPASDRQEVVNALSSRLCTLSASGAIDAAVGGLSGAVAQMAAALLGAQHTLDRFEHGRARLRQHLRGARDHVALGRAGNDLYESYAMDVAVAGFEQDLQIMAAGPVFAPWIRDYWNAQGESRRLTFENLASMLARALGSDPIVRETYIS